MPSGTGYLSSFYNPKQQKSACFTRHRMVSCHRIHPCWPIVLCTLLCASSHWALTSTTAAVTFQQTFQKTAATRVELCRKMSSTVLLPPSSLQCSKVSTAPYSHTDRQEVGKPSPCKGLQPPPLMCTPAGITLLTSDSRCDESMTPACSLLTEIAIEDSFCIWHCVPIPQFIPK